VSKPATLRITSKLCFRGIGRALNSRRPDSPLHPSRLTIESHGRRCEVGSFLTEQERRGLAQRLTRLIGRIDESPSLAV
jgi:uncharacterized membrane protein